MRAMEFEFVRKAASALRSAAAVQMGRGLENFLTALAFIGG